MQKDDRHELMDKQQAHFIQSTTIELPPYGQLTAKVKDR